MDAAIVIGLVAAGPNADLVARLGGDPSWNVAEDWGLGEWRAERAPAGLKFRRTDRGLIREEVLVVRAGEEERSAYQRLSALAQVPIHLAFLPDTPVPAHRFREPRFRG
jgi:hypothetical protein